MSAILLVILFVGTLFINATIVVAEATKRIISGFVIGGIIYITFHKGGMQGAEIAAIGLLFLSSYVALSMFHLYWGWNVGMKSHEDSRETLIWRWGGLTIVICTIVMHHLPFPTTSHPALFVTAMITGFAMAMLDYIARKRIELIHHLNAIREERGSADQRNSARTSSRWYATEGNKVFGIVGLDKRLSDVRTFLSHDDSEYSPGEDGIEQWISDDNAEEAWTMWSMLPHPLGIGLALMIPFWEGWVVFGMTLILATPFVNAVDKAWTYFAKKGR